MNTTTAKELALRELSLDLVQRMVRLDLPLKKVQEFQLPVDEVESRAAEWQAVLDEQQHQ
jgi:hypothetical protein